ncbi:MAG: apolipoprotein N-acyltransferase [Cycloclasticus sp.]|nr:apolipoprotein N-acyltransferase [Cycloclasticus sp.]
MHVRLPNVCLLMAALAAGGLLPLAFEPYGYPLMAFISPLLLLYLLRRSTGLKASLVGYLYGLGFFGHGVYWVYFSIHHFGGAPLWLAIGIMAGMVALLALYMAAFAYLLTRFFKQKPIIRYLLAFPSLWVGLECLRSVLLTGFPWLLLGYSQIDAWASGLGAVVGVFGLSWFVVSMTGAFALLLSRMPTKQTIWLVSFVIIGYLGVWPLKSQQWGEPAGKPINVALLQGNIPQAIKWQRSYRQASIDAYWGMTKQQRDADLIIWPETAIPAFYHEVNSTLLNSLRADIHQQQGADIIVGLPVKHQENNEYFNALHSIRNEGEFYFKRHLVPLGEYMPLKPLSTFILKFLSIPFSDFSSGLDDQPLLSAAGHSFASSICYEDVFQQSSLDGLPKAAYLVNISNDTWFGRTIAPAQHLQMARMRALESGRYLLRATNTGLTAIVGPTGRLISQLPMFQRSYLTGSIVPLKGSTPFVQGGWWVIWLFTGLMLVLSFINRDKRSISSQAA